MKKKLVIILAAAMAAAAVMGGCGKKDAQTGLGSASAETEAEDVQISADELLKATDYDVEEYVKLNDYLNMTVELSQSYEVTDEEVKSYIEQIIAQYPDYEKTDKTVVESGDIVNIDYEGKKDGEAFSGGTAAGAHLEIGSGSFIDGFEDGLIGKNVGETVDLNLTFPEEYGTEELAGQDVVFTVTINSIDTAVEMTYDAMTDEYVISNFSSGGLTSVDALKEQIRSNMQSQYDNSKMQEIQEKVLEKLAEECSVEFPEGLLDERVADYKAQTQAKADAAELSLEEYLQDNMQLTEEEFDEELNAVMEDSLVQELILEAIVADQDISVSESAYDSFVAQFIATYGIESEEAFYEQFGEEDYVKLSYAENQALLKVINSARTTVKAADDSEDADEEAAEE